MKSKTTIELNGNRYDASTGVALGMAPTTPAKAAKNIDGFFRGRVNPSLAESSEKITVLAAPSPVPNPHKQPSQTVNHARAHVSQTAKIATTRDTTQKLTVHRSPSAPNHAKAHAPQSSHTLMRKAVKRPAASLRKQANTQGTLQHTVPSLVVPKLSVANVDEERLARAHTTARSPQIAHHSTGSTAVQPHFAPVAVQTPPAQGSDKPPSPQPTNKPTDIFEHALANATNFVDIHAHRAHFRKHARRHVASMAAGTLALIVIAGFAAYQNTPGLQIKVASIQAGVSTNMPNFKAAGFAYNGVKAGNGKLTVGFSGASGKYQLTQQTTNLSSDDMIQNVGATDANGTSDYRAVHAGNTTVYRFNNTDATWVSGGKWYTVTGTGALTDNQVKSLVQNV